jgi:FtsP/CotA-like multicopper oxidase with cupredoxin domain
LLGPGDRAEVELLVGEAPFSVMIDPYSLNGGEAHGDPVALFQVAIEDPRPAPSPAAWPFAGGAITPDPGYADIVYAFAGSDRTDTGLINGEKFPNITVEEIALGEKSIVELRNLSPAEHPIHIHGVRFEVLSIDGVPPPRRIVEDTFNLKIRETVRVAIDADNPGDWMTHCHILPHADHGMMTVLRIR